MNPFRQSREFSLYRQLVFGLRATDPGAAAAADSTATAAPHAHDAGEGSAESERAARDAENA